jgi:hypothetical protein
MAMLYMHTPAAPRPHISLAAKWLKRGQICSPWPVALLLSPLAASLANKVYLDA